MPTARQARELGCLLLSGVAAWWAPLHVFVIAYVFLGPLHYLTEIAWLDKKEFYYRRAGVKPRIFLWVCVLMCVGIGVDQWFRRGWMTYFVVAAIVLALSSVVKRAWLLGVVLVGAAVAKHFSPGFAFFLGVLLPTLVHVYVFTLIFLVSGAMREKNKFGWVLPVALVGVPVVLVLAGGGGAVAAGGYWNAAAGSFSALREYLMGLLRLNVHPGNEGAVGVGAVRVLRVLGFAYLYHYLNWFLKTGLLEWHKMPWLKWGLIAAAYAGAVGVYLWNFDMGFAVLYYLSMLHVFLELPLNVVSIRGVAMGARERKAA